MYVLIIEDNEIVGDGIRQGLRMLGHSADWVTEAATADQAIQQVEYDVVILDLTLPDEDGLNLLTRWRHKNIDIPVLILTARDAIPDRVSGLSVGADDYLTKPFDFDELIARLQSITRRAAGRADNVISYRNIHYNPAKAEVRVGGLPIKLSKSEMIVLEALMLYPGKVINTGQLQDRLYGWTDGVSSNAIAVHIHNLRKKLGDELILTERGVGYYLALDEE
jgi:DNA-binding response OmpR family regulator